MLLRGRRYLRMATMRPALLVVLAVLGPRASAQGNAPLSRTPASPTNAAKANEGRSARDALSGWAPRPKRELQGDEAGALSEGSGDASICSLCLGAINENDAPGPEWYFVKSYVNEDVMTECTVAIFRACYQDAANMPSSVCEDEVYPIVEALGWNPPELNEIYFDYEQLIGHPNWSPDCDPNWVGCGNADPVDYYDYSGMGMDGMPSPSPYMGDYGGYGSYSSYDFNMGGYGNFETCHVEFGQPMMLNVVLFGVEGGDECPYDYLGVNGGDYCGDQPASNAGSGPMQMQFLDGQITSSLDWSSDDWFTGVGFKICTSPAPPSPPSPPNMWLEGAKCPSGSFPAPYYGAGPPPPWGAYDMPSPSPMPWPSPGSAAAPGWPSPGSEAGQNGEVACENQGFGESECNAVGCCQFDWDSQAATAPWGQCWSAVGPGPCSAAGQAPTVTNTPTAASPPAASLPAASPSGRRLDHDTPSGPLDPGTVFDGTWLYESKEEAKQACAAGCVAANENADMMADMMADMYPDGTYADMYGDMPRCAYAELYYSDSTEYGGTVYTSCNLKTDACGDYSVPYGYDDSWYDGFSLWVAPPPAPAPPPPPSLPDNYLHSTVTVTDQWADDLSWTLACEGFANFTVETEFWFTGYAETHAYPPGTQCNLHMHVSNWYDPFMYGWNGVTWSAYGWGSTAGPFSLDYEDCAGIMGL